MLKLLTMDGDAPLDGGMELLEGITRMLDGSLFALHTNPTIAGGDADFEPTF
jgi:hypothetical protein